MGGFGNLAGSDTKVDAPQTTVTGQGRNIKGNYVETGGVYLGKGSTVNSGIDLSKVTVGKGGALNVTVDGGAQALQDLSSQFAETISGITAANQADGAASQKTLADSLKGVFTDAFEQIKSLASDRVAADPNNSPIPGLSKTFLWLTLGSLGILALVWVNFKVKKKK